MRKGPAESGEPTVQGQGPAGVSLGASPSRGPGLLASSRKETRGEARESGSQPARPKCSGFRDAAPLAAGSARPGNLTDTPASSSRTSTSDPTHLRSRRARPPSSGDLSCGLTWLPARHAFLSLWLCALARPSRLGPRSFPGWVPGRSSKVSSPRFFHLTPQGSRKMGLSQGSGNCCAPELQGTRQAGL